MSKHSKSELSKIKGALLSSDNYSGAFSSISEQVEEENNLLGFTNKQVIKLHLLN